MPPTNDPYQRYADLLGEPVTEELRLFVDALDVPSLTAPLPETLAQFRPSIAIQRQEQGWTADLPSPLIAPPTSSATSERGRWSLGLVAALLLVALLMSTYLIATRLGSPPVHTFLTPGPSLTPRPSPTVTGKDCGTVGFPYEIDYNKETLHDFGTPEMIQCFVQAYAHCDRATLRTSGSSFSSGPTLTATFAIDDHCSIHVIGPYSGDKYDCPTLERHVWGLLLDCVSSSSTITVPFPNFTGPNCGRETMDQTSVNGGLHLTEHERNELFADFPCFIQAYQQCQPTVMILDTPDMNVQDPTNPEVVERVSGLHRLNIQQGPKGCFVQDVIGADRSYVATYPCAAMTVQDHTIHLVRCGIEGDIDITYTDH